MNDGPLISGGVAVANLPGSTSPTLTWTNLTTSWSNWTGIRCVLSNPCGTVSSTPATLRVLGPDAHECSPCPCSADFDGTGGAPDADDIDAFFAAWLMGDPAADTDCSEGVPDAGDVDVFFAQWLAGGC